MTYVIALGFRGLTDVEGGIERHAERLYPELVRLGCRVEVVSRSHYVRNKQVHDVDGVRVTPIWAPRGRGIEAFCHSLLALIYAAFRRPDIVHIHGIGAALLSPIGRALGLRVVVTHHGLEYDATKWGMFARNVLRAGEWVGIRFAHQCIVVSDQLHDSVLKRFRRDTAVIPNGVAAVTPVDGEDILEELGLTKTRYLIEVARFTEHKGQEQLIKAFAAADLPGWKLVLVGCDTASDAYSKRVVALASMTPNVVCAGYRTGKELAQLYCHAGIFSLPSSYEGMPLAALEALSYGLPVILSDIPAHRELALPMEFYFPTRDTDVLRDRIASIAAQAGSREIRALMRSIAGSRPGWRQIAEQTLQTYHRAQPLWEPNLKGRSLT